MNKVIIEKENQGLLQKILHSKYLTLFLVLILLIAALAWYIYQRSNRQIITNFNVDSNLSLEYKFAIGGDSSKGEYRFSEPMGVEVSDKNEIYVADTADNVIKVFDDKGKYLRSFGGKSYFYLPTDIKVIKDKVYVVDSKNSRIQVFGTNGAFKGTFAGANIGKKIGAWIPAAIDIDNSGNVYATDIFYQRVIVFNPDGTVNKYFGLPGNGDGQMMYPNGIAVDNQGNVYVADSNNGRVEVFDKMGKFRSNIKNGKETYNFNMPRGIDISSNNILYVIETFSHNIRLLKLNNGNVEKTDIVGTRGTGDGEMNFPNDVALNDNLLCIADRANNRVLVFTVD